MLEKPKRRPEGEHEDPKVDARFVALRPLLAEYQTLGYYGDGSRRQRATLTVFADEPLGWKGVLNDRDNSRSLWATGATLEEMLGCLESQLCDPEARWRHDSPRNGKAAKK